MHFVNLPCPPPANIKPAPPTAPRPSSPTLIGGGGVCRWSNVFDTMTKEREEAESAEAISSREAMQMVNEMLDKMQDKYTTSIDS